MADKNVEKENNGTPEITEADIIELKVPWWKKALKVLGYVASAAAGAITMAIIDHLGGDDDDDNLAPSETDAE